MALRDLQISPYGHYGLIERIGSGGMAEIYLAVSEGVEGFRKLVAVKRIHQHYALNARFRQMFINEAKLAALLQHPNAVQIYDLGEIDGQLFIAMEYIAGIDVARMLQGCAVSKHGLPLEVALFIASELLRGLDYAHKKTGPDGESLKLIHRDVSPSNVLVSMEGIVKLCDFGIAKAAHVASLSQAGMLKGKVCYMAPETVRGDPIDHRVDIWAAGAVLWEMLTVQRLYPGPPDYAMMERIAEGKRTPIADARPDLDAAVVQVVERALAVDREQRFQSAGEMANEIARAANTIGLLLTPDPLREYMQAHVDDTLVDVQQITSSLAAMPKEELTRSVKSKPPTVYSAANPIPLEEILEQAELSLGASTPDADVQQILAEAESALGGSGAGSALEPTAETELDVPASEPAVPAAATRGASGDGESAASNADPAAEESDRTTTAELAAQRAHTAPALEAASAQVESAAEGDAVAAEDAAPGGETPAAPEAVAAAAPAAQEGARSASPERAPAEPLPTANPGRARRQRRGSMGLVFFVVGGLGLAALIWVGLVTTMGGLPGPSASLALVSTPPGAQVRGADQGLLGTTPLRTDALPAGKHTLTIELAGFQPRQLVVDLTGGELLQQEVLLLPLREDGCPQADAAAADEGSAAPRADTGVPDRGAPAAPVPDAAVAAPDRAPAVDARPAVVDAGAPATRDASATAPAPRGPRAWITVWAKPWGYVSVDGQRLEGATPIRNHALTAGEHTLVVENPHLHRQLEHTFRLQPGQRLILRIDLTRDPPVIRR